MGLARAESFGLGLGLDRRRCGARRALVAAFLPLTGGATAVTATPLTIAPTTVTVAPTTVTVAAITVTVAAITVTVAAITVTVAAIGALTAAGTALTRAGASQRGGYERCVGRPRATDLEPVRVGTRRSGGRDRNDAQAVEVRLDLGAQDIADLGTAREDGCVECALGLAGAGGAPGPGTIIPRARELDVDPAGHRCSTLAQHPASAPTPAPASRPTKAGSEVVRRAWDSSACPTSSTSDGIRSGAGAAGLAARSAPSAPPAAGAAVPDRVAEAPLPPALVSEPARWGTSPRWGARRRGT